MKKLIALFYVLVFANYSNAQFVNNGVGIVLNPNSLMVVDMDVTNAGLLNHNGEIIAKGNWYNNESTGGFNLSSKGLVELSGNSQTIGGFSPAYFPSLRLSGSGIKKLTQDVFVLENLNITDKEFEVNDKVLTLLNKTSNSLQRTTGYISTENKGMFYRYTNSDDEYVFPMGASINNVFHYRPISIKPKDQSENSFGVSFVPKDPSLDSYYRDNKANNISQINSKYYHVIDQKIGPLGASVNLFYNHPEDEPFDKVINWTKFSVWELLGNGQEISGNTNNRIASFIPLVKMENLPIALASSLVDNPFVFYNSFSPDGDGKNDLWTIPNIDSYPDNEVRIFNRWGGEVYQAKAYSSTNKWDGSGLNTGTYYYLIKIKIGDEYKVYKGFITLVRDQKR